MSRTVIVLGGRGFLGNYITSHLRNSGLQVTTFDRSEGGPKHQRGSITESQQLTLLEKYDVIINLVGLSPIRKYPTEAYEQVHVKGMQNILDALAGANTNDKLIIQLSALGIEAGAGDYDKTKLAAENLLKKSKLKSVIIKSSFIFGRGAEFFELLNKFAWLKLFPFPKTKGRIQPIYAGDIAVLINQILSGKEKGNEFILAGPKSFQIHELVKIYLRKVKNCFVVLIPSELFRLTIWLLAKFPFFPFSANLYDYTNSINIAEPFQFENGDFELMDYEIWCASLAKGY